MEGTPGRDSLPASWYAAANTPDVLPGIFGITLPASDGKTYGGLHSGPGYREGIGQELPLPLLAGRAYSLSFDLAYAPSYLFPACYGNLVIYGGNTPSDTTERLWSSGAFTHTAWQRYTAILKPAGTYKYLSLWAQPLGNCTLSVYGVAVLMDHFSTIYELLQTEITSSPSCNNTNTGAVAVKVTGGTPPYRYQWTPGNYTTASVQRLPPGDYTVTVTSADGVTGKGQVTVGKSDLNITATVSLSKCYGDNENRITVQTIGGMAPYDFYVNGNNMRETRIFDRLAPGQYNIVVKDQQVCADTVSVRIKEPPRFLLKQAATEPCSCSEVNNGKLTLAAEGGTPPYKYRVNGDSWQQDSVMANLKAGYYQYEIRDQNNCSLTGSATVASPWKNCLVVMPSAFSPNGDGNNDIFRPKVYDDVRDYQLIVFNRWGTPVFRSNDPKMGWDGGYKGTLQPAQAYIYVCTFNDRHNEHREFRGSVLLVR